MTLLGPDLYNGQAGLDLSKLTQASFVFAKVTEGTYYTDRSYQNFRTQAAAIRMPFVWYHFLTTQDAAAQVAHTKANLVDQALPGMLDVEPQLQTGSRPTLEDITAYADIAKAAGLRPRLVYLPHWYWQELGSPDLTPLIKRGLYLVSSSYPGGTGSPAALYPGDSAVGWTSYGRMVPAFYQFTNRAADGGMALDYNAFRGTPQDLLNLLGGTDMGTYTMGDGWQKDYPDVAAALQAHIPAGTVIDEGDAAAYSMVRSFVAAERAGAINGKLDQLLARTSTVDVPALAAALGPLIHPETDVDALAAALVPHLPGAPDPGAFAQALAGHIKVV